MNKKNKCLGPCLSRLPMIAAFAVIAAGLLNSPAGEKKCFKIEGGPEWDSIMNSPVNCPQVHNGSKTCVGTCEKWAFRRDERCDPADKGYKECYDETVPNVIKKYRGNCFAVAWNACACNAHELFGSEPGTPANVKRVKEVKEDGCGGCPRHPVG